MKKLLWLLLLLPTLAQAADNTVILTPGTGVTMRSIDIGAGVQSSGVNIINSAGTSILGTAGTANASVLSIQGIASGTTLPVTEINSAAILSAISGSIPAGSALIGGTTAYYGTTASVSDPCKTVAKTYTPISITTATTTRIIAPTAAKKTYICYMYLQTTAANNIAVVEGTGGACGSSTAGIVGGTTAANGLNNAANSGQVFNNGGYAALATAGTNVDLCLITSAATPLAGHVVWVAQ